MGSTQDTFIEPALPLVFGICPGCGKDNEYSPFRLADYQKKRFKLSSFCTICLFKKRATDPSVSAREWIPALAALVDEVLGLGRIVAFAPPLIHFIPDSLRGSVALFLKRQ